MTNSRYQVVSRWIKYAGLLAGLGMIALLASLWTVGEPESAAAESHLKDQLGQIQPPWQAVSQDCESWHKADRAFAQCVYTIDLSYMEIRSYYDEELASHGWTFVSEEPVQFAGKDYGGRVANYRKGEYRATLEYTGNKGGWDYSISMTWRAGRL